MELPLHGYTSAQKHQRTMLTKSVTDNSAQNSTNNAGVSQVTLHMESCNNTNLSQIFTGCSTVPNRDLFVPAKTNTQEIFF
jgi:hypothetical protein